MDTLQALQKMLDSSDMTPYAVARSLGRGSSYVSGMVWRGSCPSADLLARLAGACGWRLVLVRDDGGSEITITGATDDSPPAG